MKKFTKITLIIAAVLAALGILFCGIAAAMGAGWSTMRTRVNGGEFDIGNLHVRTDGIYFGGDELCDIGTAISDAVQQVDRPGGTESTAASFHLSDIKQMDLEIDVADEVVFETSKETDAITITMENGFEKYFSTEQDGKELKVVYDTRHQNFQNGPTITILLPEQSDHLTLNLELDVGDVSLKDDALQLFKLNLSVGVGEVRLEDLIMTGNAIMQVGTGDICISGGYYGDLSLSSGIGNIDFDSDVMEKLNAETGTGDIDVILPKTQDEYRYEVTTGLGDINVNDKIKASFAGDFQTGQESAPAIELQSGTGDILIRTK